MSEKLSMFKMELDSINLVLDKLVTKQNSSVFDKLCIKCNDLLDKIIAVIPEINSSLEIQSVIDILKSLRSSAVKLSDYKQYLIATINANLATLQEENNIISLENAKSKKLVFNNDNKNAA